MDELVQETEEGEFIAIEIDGSSIFFPIGWQDYANKPHFAKSYRIFGEGLQF